MTGPHRLRTPDAARHVGLAVATLKKMRMDRTGPAYEKHGRLVYYTVADLDAWLDSRVTARFESRKAASSSERVAS